MIYIATKFAFFSGRVQMVPYNVKCECVLGQLFFEVHKGILAKQQTAVSRAKGFNFTQRFISALFPVHLTI